MQQFFGVIIAIIGIAAIGILMMIYHFIDKIREWRKES
jgi:uncharacterized integral membrane protein